MLAPSPQRLHAELLSCPPWPATAGRPGSLQQAALQPQPGVDFRVLALDKFQPLTACCDRSADCAPFTTSQVPQGQKMAQRPEGIPQWSLAAAQQRQCRPPDRLGQTRRSQTGNHSLWQTISHRLDETCASVHWVSSSWGTTWVDAVHRSLFGNGNDGRDIEVASER